MTALSRQLKTLYVAVMMRVVGWGLRAMSQVDPVLRAEAAGFAEGMFIEMTVVPDGPGMVLERLPSGKLAYRGSRIDRRPDLSVRFKHLDLAFAVLSFSESTPTAFARARMVVDGDIGAGIRLVRCLYRLEALLLPKFIARRGMKRYPADLSLGKKLAMNLRIYGRMAADLVTRS
ncbi:MAG: hypothetical protein P8080_04060 [Gammaproteobacteria bacterium]